MTPQLLASMPSAVDRVRTFVRSFFRPVERLTPSRWIEKYIRLPAGHSETQSGAIDFANAPELREPLDALEEPGVTDILFSGPTRIGKTLLLRCAFAVSVAKHFASMLWIDSTMDKARSVVRKELIPLVEANRILRDRKPANPHHFSTQEMLFPGASFNIYGANSEAQVAGDTVRRILGNEVGKWRGATEEEAAILDLARHRTESFEADRKHFFSSTPTRAGSLFWQEVERGDLRLRFVPCPRCGHLQPMEWDGRLGYGRVVWSPRARRPDGTWDLEIVRDTARFSCCRPECVAHDPTGEKGTGWTDAERLAARIDPRAEWRPTKEPTPGFRSYVLLGMYGRLRVNTFAALATDFCTARTGAFFADLQDFYNSRIGLPFLETLAEISLKKLAELERPYERGQLPAGWKADVLVLGFDVQTWGFPWVLRAFQWTGESYLVDHGTAAGWADLDAVQADYASLAPASFAIGDINFEDRRAEVLEQIWRRQARGWMAADGVDFSRDRVRVESANVFMGGKLQGEKILVPKLIISTYDFKLEIEKRLAGEIRNWWLYQPPLTATAQELEEFAEYKTQILDERRVPRKRKRAGLPETEFRARTGNNHFGDDEVYILALFYVLQRKRSHRARQAGSSAPQRRVMQVTR